MKTTRNTHAKKFLSLLLSMLLLTENFLGLGTIAYATGEEEPLTTIMETEETLPDASLSAPEPALSSIADDSLMQANSAEDTVRELLINGVVAVGNVFRLSYKQAASFSMAGLGNAEVEVSFNDSGDPSYDTSPFSWELLVPREAPYYLFAHASANDETYTSPTYTLYVEKAVLSAPANPLWANGAMSWDEVVTATNGSVLPTKALAGYHLSIYRDNQLISTEPLITVNDIRNFNQHIIDSYGAGTYSFKLVALPANEYYAPSAEVSGGPYIVPQISIVAGEGVLSVAPAQPLLLFPGSVPNSVNISATPASGYAFSQWQSSDPALSIQQNKDGSFTASLVDNPASSAITLTAIGTDNRAPQANTPRYHSANTIEASGSDSESGIVAYAFGNNQSEDYTELSWTNLKAPVPSGTYTYKIDAPGVYYFYLKDASGHIGKSDEGLLAREIRFHNYPNEADKKDYLLNGNPLTLPEPSKAGYCFSGWYDNEDFNGSALATVTTAPESGLDLYAKWTAQSLEGASCNNINSFYMGEALPLTVTLPDGISGLVEYAWYKQEEDSWTALASTSATLSLKNVGDSGNYKLILTLKDGDNQLLDEKEILTTVLIKKTPLTIGAKDYTIHQGEEAPNYELTYEGLQGDDEGQGANIVPHVSLACTYKQGDPPQTYPIIVSSSSDLSLVENYTVQLENGTVTVLPNTGVITLSIADEACVYNGQEQKPAVTVTLDNEEFNLHTLLTSDDYSLLYANNINAGQASVTVTLKGNFAGEKTGTFTIRQADLPLNAVHQQSWMYGDAAPAPLPVMEEGEALPSDATVSYLYALLDDNEGELSWSDERPTDAGAYRIQASITGMNNYKDIVVYADFSISPRKIILRSASAAFTYTGSAQSAGTYTMEGDGFAPGEGFSFVSVTGSISNVSESPRDNALSYELSADTHAINYEIEIIPGTLTMGKLALPQPADAAWSRLYPARASWIPITRSGFSVTYKLQLLAQLGDTVREIGNEVEAAAPYYDFSSAIRADASARATLGEGWVYSFTLQALPANETSAQNYSESNPYTSANTLSTAHILLEADNISISRAYLQSEGISSLILLQGESLTAHAFAQDGFAFEANGTWAISQGNEGIAISSAQGSGDESNAVVAFQGENSLVDIVLSVSAQDQAPVIEHFSAQNSLDLQSVTLTLVGLDGIALSSWAIAPVGEELVWEELSSTLSLSQFVEIRESGEYRAYLQDSNGNITVSENTIHIYKTLFDKGDNSAQGEMDSILHAQNTSITLPLNRFTNEGFVFRNWNAPSGLHGDGESYLVNKDETLTALWTDEFYHYTVRYHYMNVDGTYPEEAESVKEFNGPYNAVINSGSSAIARTKFGYSLDESEDRISQITLSDNDLSLDVYYKRNHYTLSYSCEDAQGNTHTGSESFLFGASVSDYLSALQDQYEREDFRGWYADQIGPAPDTMPAENISIYGVYTVDEVNYTLRPFLQDLDENGQAFPNAFSFDPALTVAQKGFDGLNVTIGKNDAPLIPGYSVFALCSTDEAANESVTLPAVQDMVVDIYYVRNNYSATLKIWDGQVNVGEPLYSYETNCFFGAALPEGFANTWSEAWTIPAGKKLSNQIVWSTGEKPATMPAGDLIVNRQLISLAEAEYTLHVYTEKVDGSYAHAGSYQGIGVVDTTVTAGTKEDDSIRLQQLHIPYFSYYMLNEEHENSKLSGIVAEDGSLELSVYLERKTYTSTITYYYRALGETSDTAFATVAKERKWGVSYDTELSAYFLGGEQWNEEVTVQTPNTLKEGFNFKENQYKVSYHGSYSLNSTRYTPSGNYPNSNAISAQTPITMGYDNATNYVNVYYVQVKPLQYKVQVFYNAKRWPGLSQGINQDIPVQFNGKNVYLANEAWFYENPAFDINTGAFSVQNATLKTGYTYHSEHGGYYEAEDGIYIPLKDNPFYYGNNASASYNCVTAPTAPGTEQINVFIESYRAENLDDPKATGTKVYYHGYGRTRVFNANEEYVGKLIVTFDEGDTVQMYHYVNGIFCGGHTVAQGTSHTFIDDASFPQRTGYEIVWYEDSGFKTKVDPEKLYLMNGDRTFYGKYEKSVVLSRGFTYYQLPEGLTIEGATYQDYLPKELVMGSDSFTSRTEENGITIYSYQDMPVLAYEEIRQESFSDISMRAVAQHGLHFDTTDSRNLTAGFNDASGIDLCAYYARDSFTLSWNTAIEGESVTTETYRYGQTIQCPADPVRNGYDFSLWQFTDQEGYTIQAPLTMPVNNLEATAIWTPGNLQVPVFHLFQSKTRAYGKAKLQELLDMDGVPTRAVTFQDEDYTASTYGNGYYSLILGAQQYFFLSEDSTLTWRELVAITAELELMQDDALVYAPLSAIDPIYYPDYALFVQESGATHPFTADSTDTNAYGMQLEYYYARVPHTVSATAYKTGGEGSEAAIVGEGSYLHDEEASLNLTLPAGFFFQGWFIADGEHKPVGNALSTDLAYSFAVSGDVELLAVISPMPVAVPLVTLSSAPPLIYGYEDAKDNVINASVTFPAQGANGCKVSAYRWYVDDVLFEGASGANFRIPTSWDAGERTISCVVEVTNVNNGLQILTDAVSTPLRVEKARLPVSISGVNCVYDGEKHAITVTPDGTAYADAVVYFSTSALNADNYRTAGTTAPILVKDVKVDEAGQTIPTTIYYYIHTNDNYHHQQGSQTIRITPKSVHLEAGSDSYTMEYTGSAQVEGENLSRLFTQDDLFHVIGLIPGDQANAGINGNASFNSRHVSDASKVTLSGLMVISDGERNYNYAFPDAYSIALSAEILQRPLQLCWNGDNLVKEEGKTPYFIYNGMEQALFVTVAEETPLPKVDEENGLSFLVNGTQTNAHKAYIAAATGSFANTAVENLEEQSRMGDYKLSGSTFTFDILPRPLTLNMVSETIPYDGEEHTLSERELSLGALVPGHQIRVVDNLLPSYKNAGTYAISSGSVSIFDQDNMSVSGNYQLTYGSEGTLTITKRPVSLSGITAQDKVYDGSASVTLVTDKIKLSNVVAGDQLTVNQNAISGLFSDAGVDSHKTVTLSYGEDLLTGAQADNYVLETPQAECYASITPATITLTARDTSMHYGDESAPFAYSVSGLIGGEVTEDVIRGLDNLPYAKANATLYTSATLKTLSVGSHDIYPVVSGLSSDNYIFQAAVGTLTVSPKELTITLQDNLSLNKVYDGTDKAEMLVRSSAGIVKSELYSLLGLEGSDSVTIGFETAAFNSKDVAQANSITLTGLHSLNDNYTLSDSTLTMQGTIAKAPLTVQADKKQLTYGDPLPPFTATYTGFVNGEKQSVLETKPVFSCDYDPAVPEKRGATNYNIVCTTPNSDDNYEYSISGNTMSVQKATIAITASTADGKTTLLYGKPYTHAPQFTYTGWKYGESLETIATEGEVTCPSPVSVETQNINRLVEGEEVTTTEDVVISTPGNHYFLTPASSLVADNYRFVTQATEIAVGKLNLSISGVTVENKIYDGTTAITPNTDRAFFDGLLQKDNALKASGLTVAGSFEEKNVGEHKNVSLTLGITGELANFYNLETEHTQNSTLADITPRPITLKAKDTKTVYAQEVPANQFAFDVLKNAQSMGLGTGDALSLANVSFNPCSIRAEDNSLRQQGTYADEVTINAVANSTSNSKFDTDNYTITLEEGDLIIVGGKLATPKPIWSTETPGTITWQAIEGIGDVAVESYLLTLYRNGSEVEQTMVMHGSPLSVNFATAMHQLSAQYTVGIHAIPAEENNAERKTVLKSDEGISPVLYAPEVSFTFAKDGDFNAFETENFGNILATDQRVNGVSAYVMIPGETNIPLSATLVNGTGYTIKTIVSDNPALTLDKGDDSARDDDIVSAAVSLSRNNASISPITVTMVLSPRPASLEVSLSVAPENRTITYGYSSTACSITAVPSHNDTVAPTDGYTYSYIWQSRESNSSAATFGSSQATVYFPTGKRASGSNQEWHLVRCNVSATRSDNGETALANAPRWSSDYANVTNIIVSRADFTCEVALDGWIYGQEPKNPSVINPIVSESENANLNNPSYAYRKQGEEEWSSIKPSDAGNYQVQAYVAESTNYNAFTTPPKAFSIEKATLATPSTLALDVSGSTSYGRFRWEWNSPIYPDGNASNAPVPVSYKLGLYVQGTDTPIAESVVQEDKNTAKLWDVSSLLEAGQIYTIKVQAISGNSNNCFDSAIAELDNINIGVTITTEGVSKVYDGEYASMTASFTGATHFQWYKGNQPIDGANSATYRVLHVDESHDSYSCVVTQGNKTIYSPIVKVSITPRELTFTSQDAEKVFDGVILKKEEVSVSTLESSAQGAAFVTNDTVAFSDFATLRDVQYDTEGAVTSYPNTFSYTIHYSQGREGDYAVTVVNGALKVTPKPLPDSDISMVRPENVTYADKDYTPQPKLTYTVGKNELSLTAGSDFNYSYEDNHNVGTARVTATGKGNYSGVISQSFAIEQRPVTFVGESKTLLYKGSEQELTGITHNLLSGHGYTLLSYSAKGKEVTAEGYAGTFNGDVKITDSKGVDVTANYAIQHTPGKLTIAPSDKVFSVSLADDTLVYNGLAQSSGKNAQLSGLYEGDNASIVYSFAESGPYTEDLKALSRKDAGSYTIYVQATNPNYAHVAKATSKLIIGKAPLSVTTTSDSKTYDAQALTNSGIEISGFVNGETAFYQTTGTITHAGETPNTYEIRFKDQDNSSTADKNNYAITLENLGSLRISKRAVTFTGETATLMYNGEFQQISQLTHDLLPGHSYSNLSYSARGKYPVEAGYIGTFSGTAIIQDQLGNNVTANYAIDKVSGKLFITASDKEFSVFLPNESLVYNAQAQSSGQTPSVTGLYEGDEASISYSFQEDGTYTENLSELTMTNAGAYTIFLKATNPRYTKTALSSALLIIKPLDVTLSVTGNNQTTAFDGQEHQTSGYTASADSELFLVDEYLVFTGNDSARRTDVGVSYMELAKEHFASSNPNFVLHPLITDGFQEISVNPVAITFTAPSHEKVYDGTPLTKTDGVIASGIPSALQYLATAEGSQTDFGVGVNKVNSYQILLGDKDVTSNFSNISTANGTLSVAKAPLIIKTGSTSGVYDGQALTSAEASIEGLVNEELVTITAKGEQTNVGSSVNSYSLAWGEAQESNYSIQEELGTITVNPRAISFLGESGERTFNGQEQSLTAVSVGEAGLVPGHTHNLAYLAKGKDASAAPYAGAFSFLSGDKVQILDKNGKDVTANYSITGFQPGALTINPFSGITVTIVGNHTTVEYDGMAHDIAGYGVTGISNSLYTEADFRLVGSGKATGKDVGITNMNLQFENISADFNTDGVLFVIEDGYVEITPAPLTITTASGEKVYDGTALSSPTISVSGLKNGETVFGEAVGSITDFGQVSNDYTLTFQGPGNAFTAKESNYQIMEELGTLSIYKRPVTFHGQSDSVVYNGNEQALHDITHNLLPDHSFENLRYSAKGRDVSTYEGVFHGNVTIKEGEKDVTGNYQIQYLPGSLTLTPLPAPSALAKNELSLTPPANTVYNGSEHTPAPELSYKGEILAEGTDYTLSFASNIDAGSADVTITFKGNFSGTLETGFEIAKLPVVLKWNDPNATYNGQNCSITATVSNTVAGEKVSIGTYNGNIALHAGQYKAQALTLTGEDAENYTLEDGANLSYYWRIAKAPLTLQADDISTVLPNALSPLSYSITAGTLFAEDSIGNISLRSQAGAKAGQFPIEIVVDNPNPDYELTTVAGVYTLEEQPTGEETPVPSPAPTPPIEPDEPAATAHGGCMWHWWMIVTDLVYLLVLALTARKDKEYNQEWEKRRKKSRRNRWLSALPFAIIFAILNILGFCRWELPLTIISVIVVFSLSYLSYRRKFHEQEP